MFKILKEITERAKYLQFRSVHTRSRSGIEKWQMKKLRTLAAYVSKNVPLYAGIFAEHGVDPKSLTSLSDLQRLPITNKSTYVGKEIEEYTDNSQQRTGCWVTTSGTSGKPFTILRIPQIYSPLYVDLMLYRFLFKGKPWRFARSEKVIRIWPKSSDLKNCVEIFIGAFLTDTEKTTRYIGAVDADIVETYAGVLQVLAEEVKKSNIPLKPRYVISCAERMSFASRSFIRDVLDSEVFDRYGMEEFGAMAMECSRHEGLHIYSESFIVEIVDEHGAVLPEGSHGRIVVTDLFNSQMPFIRYDTGDHGKLSWQKCSCGEETPRLTLEGRYSAFLTLNGRRIHHLEFDVALEIFMNSIIQYQIVKEESDKITISIIPAMDFDDVVREKVVSRVRSLVGPDVKIEMRVVNTIPKSPRGKSQLVVDMTQ